MVLLSPKFVFVALLASLTAISLAPPTDAAAIAMRRTTQHHISDSSEPRSSSSLSHGDHPMLPLPAHLTSASGKQSEGRSGTPSRGNPKRRSPRDFFASERRALTSEDLPPLLTRRAPSHHNGHQPQGQGSPPDASAQPSTLEVSGARPFVHINGANSHATFDRRAPDPHPDPRHSHHHHGDHHDHDKHHGSKHAEDVVVIEGDNDDVHIGRRSPPSHHHQHERWRKLGGNDKRLLEDSNLGRRSPDPRHDDHHHHDHSGHGHHKGGHGQEKVIVKGDDNNVSVHSRSRVARDQGRNHPQEHQSDSSHAGHHQHHDRAREHVSPYRSHHDSASADDADKAKAYHGRHTRSVLINSVEGEEKYLVPDDYQDQRVTVIEGDGISKMLAKAKRGDPGIEGVPGSIEIMSQSAMSETGQRIASLVLVEPDSTMSEFGNSTFILNASENNQTQLYMVALNTTSSGVEGEDVPVALKVPVFNPDSASIESYCATYDPEPLAPAPLSVEKCFYDEPTGPHKSQVFSYTPSTSVIRPMWFGGETDEEDVLDDPVSNSTAKPDATVDPKTPLGSDMTSITDVGEFGNSTAPPPSVYKSSGIDQGLTETGTGNDSMIPSGVDFAAKAQNVTLVFTPATLVVPAGLRTDLSDGTPMSETNGTGSPLSSGGMNETETLDGDGLPSSSTLSPHSTRPGTVSPAANPMESGVSEDGQELNVMVGVAREEGDMRAVSTAPYKWLFDRERS